MPLFLPASLGAVQLGFVSVSTTGTDTSNTHVSIGTLSAVITRSLPASPSTGDVVEYKAPSNATDFPVTISGNGHTIDGASTFPMNVSYMGMRFTYNGTEWEAN